MKNLQNLVEAVALETGIPAPKVRKISLALLEKLATLIDTQEQFNSPVVQITPVTAPSQPASGKKTARPEIKFGRFTRRTSVPKS